MEKFAEAFREIAGREIGPGVVLETVEIDASLAVQEVDEELLTWLRHAGPYGTGHPAPVFVTRGVKIRDSRAVGAGGAHLRFVLDDGDEGLEGIGFGAGARHAEVARGGRFDVAYRLEVNRWNGRSRIQAQLVDFRPGGA
jgi:single-stranded-DNA-specific exonuclease